MALGSLQWEAKDGKRAHVGTGHDGDDHDGTDDARPVSREERLSASRDAESFFRSAGST